MSANVLMVQGCTSDAGKSALVTALWMSDRAWALYNGLIAYVLIGLLFGAEWLVRQRVKAGYRHG